MRLELPLLSLGHFLQDDRPHERVAPLRLEEEKPPKLGAIGRAEEDQMWKRGMRRLFDPQPVGMSGSGEVA